MIARLGIPALVALAALGGCVEPGANPPAQPVSAASAAGPVVPGETPADAIFAAALFGQICAENAPTFRNAGATLGGLPFRQHPQTGTYYHSNVNLSVKIFPPSSGTTACSMVFVSRDDAMTIGLAIAAQVSDDGQIGVNPDTGATMAQGPGGTVLIVEPTIRQGRDQFYRAVLRAGN
ncbi:hypothetical protein [Marivivens marinus]|uniref:hypothetical protein n=1 Tax=Marivivens marinus TaxID=3110173 RepID=UPI003B8490C5